MAVIVTEQTLKANEFDKGAGGAWYYGTEKSHIHLIYEWRGTDPSQCRFDQD